MNYYLTCRRIFLTPVAINLLRKIKINKSNKFLFYVHSKKLQVVFFCFCFVFRYMTNKMFYFKTEVFYIALWKSKY